MTFSPFAIAVAASNITQGSDGAESGLTSKVTGFLQFFFGKLPSWIAAFIILGLSIGIARMIRSFVETKIAAKVDEEHQEIVVLGGRISYVTTLTVGITAALKIAGIDLTTILAAVAFGIGFALRDLIMNFIAGVYILMSRHFTIGDFIKVNGIIGKIVEIQSRATILKAIDGTKVIVPNSDLFSNSVISYTGNPMRRVTVPLYVSYDADLDYAIKITMQTMQGNQKILKKPKPSVLIKDYGDSTIDLVARFWVLTKDRWVMVRSDMINRFSKAYDEAGIHIPYDILHLETTSDTAEERKLEDAAMSAMKSKTTISATANAVLTPYTSPQNDNGENTNLDPEGAYQDETDIDDQTIDNKG